MLSKVKALTGYKLKGRDGEIGNVKEFYFDDRSWTVRYLVADTGNWLSGRQVLISPRSLVAVMKDQEDISVDLTKEQIEGSPSLDSDKPVSLQFEQAYYGYYGWPAYWGGAHVWGGYPFLVPNRESVGESINGGKEWDHNLRSTKHVSGYDVQAVDGSIGHIDDFVIDDKTWEIRYLIVDTRSWWPGKKVLISPRWIDNISWTEAQVHVSVTREAIKQSPEYLEDSLQSRDYEDALHRHYDRQGYWVDEVSNKAHVL